VIKFGSKVGPLANVYPVPARDHFDVPKKGKSTTLGWLTKQLSADGKRLVAVQKRNKNNQFRNVSRFGGTQHPRPSNYQPSPSKRSVPAIQSNPFLK